MTARVPAVELARATATVDWMPMAEGQANPRPPLPRLATAAAEASVHTRGAHPAYVRPDTGARRLEELCYIKAMAVYALSLLLQERPIGKKTPTTL